MAITVTNTDNEADGGSRQLAGATAAASAVVNGVTYVFVGGAEDGGISVYRLDPGGSLTPVYDVADDGALALAGLTALEVATVGDDVFLYATGADDNGISGFRVNDDGSLAAIGTVYDTADTRLARPQDLAVATRDSRTFLYAASESESGLCFFEIGSDGGLTHIGNGADASGLRLANTQRVTTMLHNGLPHIVATGEDDNGWSMFRVGTNGLLSHFATLGEPTSAALTGAYGITTAVSGGNRFLIVTAKDDASFNVFKFEAGVTTLTAALRHGAPLDVTSLTVGSETYLAISSMSGGVNLYRLSATGTVVFTGNIADSATLNLGGEVHVFPAVAGGVTYLIATGSGDDGFSVFSLTPPNTAPTPGVNAGLTVAEGGTGTITAALLDFDDAEQADAAITYFVNSVTNGTLYRDGVALGLGGSFTQADIADGLIAFVHDGSETLSAGFDFSVTDNEGGGVGGQRFAISVTPVDDAPTAVDDSGLGVAENATITIDVLANDIDPGGIIEIDGQGAEIGVPVTLSNGATVTLNPDGTLTYNPNGKFNHLVPSATGATNTSATQTFGYALDNGSDAIVTVTITGVTSLGDRLQGVAGSETLTGTSAADLFMLAGGGSDTATGGGGDDGFYMGGSLDAGDIIDGGTNPGTNDQLGLQGNYTHSFSATNLVGIETLVLLSGAEASYGDTAGNRYDYTLTTIDANVAAGQTLTINANQLQTGEDLYFDGSAETDGAFRFQCSGGDDVLIGGAGADQFYGMWGQDSMTGGGGNDVFYFRYQTESVAGARDRILDFTAGDRINFAGMDANTGMGGDQAFAFIGSSAFSNVAGQLRVTGSGTGWTVEVDVNGDGAADFAVEVTTAASGHGWSAADFVL